MARVNHVISHLIHLDPKKAKDLILTALRDNKMHVGDAAKAIGCTHGTLLIWIGKLEMQPAVEKLRALATREGWHHDRHGGRPKMTAKALAAAKAAREAMTPAQRKAALAKRSKKAEKPEKAKAKKAA